jgi:hypothetical protein
MARLAGGRASLSTRAYILQGKERPGSVCVLVF